MVAAAVMTGCAGTPPVAKLSTEPLADGLHRVEVRSPGALLVPPNHAAQRDAARDAGGYAMSACTVAFAGEHDEPEMKPLLETLNARFCARVREQLASQSGIRTGDSAPGKILLEAYMLNLDPSGVAGSSEQIRFSKGMAGRLYIKGTLNGQAALRYSENLQLSRGDAEQSLARAVDSGVANLSQIYRRLQGVAPDVAAPSN